MVAGVLERPLGLPLTPRFHEVDLRPPFAIAWFRLFYCLFFPWDWPGLLCHGWSRPHQAVAANILLDIEVLIACHKGGGLGFTASREGTVEGIDHPWLRRSGRLRQLMRRGVGRRRRGLFGVDLRRSDLSDQLCRGFSTSGVGSAFGSCAIGRARR